MGNGVVTPLIDRPIDSTGVARRRVLFEEAVTAIEQRYDQDRLNVVALARTMFTSKRRLQRAFAERGTTFQATLHAVRMERSAELLLESSLPVAQIAHRVGYRSPAQFAKAFRRQYQLAPTQLRRISPSSGLTTRKVISTECNCDCQTANLRQGAPPRPKRDKQRREIERRLEGLDRRIRGLHQAA